MTKTIINFLSFLLIFVSICLLSFFYYIKPQREFIKANTQNCISKAMEPINQEVVKNLPTPYVTQEGFIKMQKAQVSKINECISQYNTILYSRPEKNMLFLNVNSLIDIQNTKINDYIKKINDKITADNNEKTKQLASQKQRQDQINACRNVKPERDKYQNCLKEEMDKNPSDSNIFTYMISPNINQENNGCLKKYNYFRFGVSELDCIFMGIDIY